MSTKTITFGTPAANKIAKDAREVELSLEYLENLPDPTENEMWLMEAIEDLTETKIQLQSLENEVQIALEEERKYRTLVLEERRHETRTSK